MTVQFAEFTKEEYKIVTAIIRRAVKAGIYSDTLTCDMDISTVHFHTPLRLTDLLGADNFNFSRDMRGIQRHINRQTGELEDFFLPRFARPQPEPAMSNDAEDRSNRGGW